MSVTSAISTVAAAMFTDGYFGFFSCAGDACAIGSSHNIWCTGRSLLFATSDLAIAKVAVAVFNKAFFGF